MEVILLQRIGRLGQMGDVVTVRDGYARNFLLPQKKAIRATEENRTKFESQRSQLEANNLELKKEAEAVAEKLGGKVFVVIRSAGDSGQLYGSVSTRDIADVVTEGGFTVERRQVVVGLLERREADAAVAHELDRNGEDVGGRVEAAVDDEAEADV